MKNCSVCKLSKSKENFGKHRGRSDGFDSQCKQCIHEKNVKHYAENADAVKEKNRLQYQTRKEKAKKTSKEYYYANREVVLAKSLVRQKRKLKEDPKYRLSRRLRNRLWYALQKKSWKKNTKFSAYIGCTLDELKAHIESLFVAEMTWENMGSWHIDYIVPLSSALTEEAMYKLCHFSNLTPLWARDNLSKGAKL